MQIAVASGKGGTGKTLIASCLARILAADQVLVLDADVEEPNTGIVLSLQAEHKKSVSRPVPFIKNDRCTFCGRCAEVCQFNALLVLPEKVMVFSELCHSCGACMALCPEKAITEIAYYTGDMEFSSFGNNGSLITGRLSVGEAMSPPLIRAVKKQINSSPYTIIDCPPGTTCPMIEAIRGSDFCLMVTEPTPFGLHDLELSLEAARLLQIPCGLIINRWQNDDGRIPDLAEKFQVSILGRIPFSLALAKAYARGENPLQTLPELQGILQEIMEYVVALTREEGGR